MPYSYLTFAQARAQLADMLNNPFPFWSDAELGLYIIEALRTWNAACNYWKQQGTFNTTNAQAWYDIPTVLPALRGYNVTDTQIVQLIEYHFLEPATGTGWTGSDQFDITQLTEAIQRRRDQFLLETATVLTQYTQAITVPNITGRYAFSGTNAEKVIDLRRLSWKDGPTGDYSTIFRQDEYISTAYNPTWQQAPDTPQFYSMELSEPLAVQLIPPPANQGVLNLTATLSGAALNPAAGVLLGVPDDFSWVVKWGAMADLLSADGQGRDPGRAEYCQKRWDEGIQLARIAISVQMPRINNVTIFSQTLWDLDTYSPGWEGSGGSPVSFAMGGLNLFALNPVPDAGPYSLTMDVVQNAPIPTSDGSYLQISKEELEAILRYSKHLACFKMGGAEFEATYSDITVMMKLASLKNDRLRANANAFASLSDRSWIESAYRPRMQVSQ